VEHDKTEDKSLKFVVLVLLRLLPVSFREFAESTTEVSLQILRSLVRHLNGVLEDGLGNDFLMRKTRRLR